MEHRDFGGAEGDLSFGKRSACPVADVAQSGMADVGQLRPDLVVAAGFEPDVDKASAAAGAGQGKLEAGLPAFAGGGIRNPAGGAVYPFDGMDQPARGLPEDA